MNTLLQTRALALAGAVVGGLTIVLCFTIYAIAGRPDPWMDLFVGSGPTVSGWAVGIAEGALVGAFQGLFLGLCYNWLAKPRLEAR